MPISNGSNMSNPKTSRALRRLSLTIAVFMTLNHSSRGALIGTATLVKDPLVHLNFNAPESGLGSPWIAYQLSLVATAGELVGAVDVSITGNVLHQRWVDNDFDGVTDPSPNGAASDGRGDSHLTAPAGSPFGAGPTETNSKTGSPLTSTPGMTEYGLGNLSGAWAILNPTATTNIAYLVVKESDVNLGKLQITVKSANPSGTSYPTLTSNSGFFCFDCSPLYVADETIDNVNANVPGSIHHQFAADAPGSLVLISNLKLDSYVPAPGTSGTGPAIAAVLNNTGSTNFFDWNTVGSPLGTYKWSYTASAALAQANGSLTVRITAVPEPASVVLMLLGVMAVVSNRGRR